MLSGAILVFVLACEEFAVPLVLGPSARYPTVQREIFVSMTAFPTQPTYGAALAVLLMLVSISGIVIYRRTTRASRWRSACCTSRSPSCCRSQRWSPAHS